MTLDKILESKTSLYVGGLICSLIGGIFLLIDDFAGWYWYVWGSGYGWGWIGFPSVLENFPDSLLIMPLFLGAAGGLFYCSIISLLGLLNQENPPARQLFLVGIILSLATLVICLIGGLIVAIEMIFEDLEFWYGGAFWGGTVGGTLTALFMYFLWRE
ncbi:MAG: hypothetical protein ACXADY_11080 [Candidatus Hodarchaeales archaeon]|jgi:hypothetical protein